MDTNIRMPFLERRKDNLHIQKSVQPNGGTAFGRHSFVKLVAGVLVPCVTGDVVCYGWVPSESKGPDAKPPEALYGQNHWPFDPRDSQFVMNITNGTGAIGQAAGAPQLGSALVGTAYGLFRDANGNQMLNVADTATPFARVVAYYPNQALTDYNGQVLVELLESVIQA
jgi:hypothetical protein